MVSSKTNNMTDLEKCQILYDYLRGRKTPEGFRGISALHLSPKASFSIVYVIQEALGLLSDAIEQCNVCKELFDSDCEGVYGGDKVDTDRKTKYHGKHFCDICTPSDIWNKQEECR